MISINDAEEILKKEYCSDNFNYLIGKILLPDFVSNIHIVNVDSNLFDKVNQIGCSDKCELTVYEVILKDKCENKRVGITQEMFRILKRFRINNALVSFVNQNKMSYRLSLLTSKYEFDGEKIVKVLSNPRRYSYSLGYGAKTKTPYKFLISKGKVNNLDELIERFSVEVVNRQFYSEISTAFTKLIGGERNGVNYNGVLSLPVSTDKIKYPEFAVRLIGRLVFCRFLLEKVSSNGLPLLPKNIFSKEKIDDCDNYYHEVIEPLFFELLNTNQKRRKEYFINEYYKKIPYLNGGLFSPHFDDFYSFDSVKKCGKFGNVTIPNEWFIDFFGILNEYNFTVDENTSYDIELSIDPEMLGRIFENLLAEINPETGENAKKSTGSFYTPRDIVDYMVDNSLLSFLKEQTQISDEKLSALINYSKDIDVSFEQNEKLALINALYKITVLDPACGSGAFPIGMLQKIVYILQELDPDAKMWFEKTTENVDPLFKREIKNKFDSGSLNYIRKLSVIKNSIFGIDLQPIAVEISRLRCFLSLIIEEKVDDDEPNRGINPLPNLDFKFIIANSLIHLDEDSQISLFDNEDHINQLKYVRDEYFNTDSERRAELKLEFANIQQNMLIQNIDSSKTVSKRYYQLSAWKPFQNNPSDWFDADWMFGIKKGFDIVIGNPPYIHFEDIKEQSKNLYKPLRYYKSYEARGDIYTLFYEMGLYNLAKNGVLCFITSNKWMRAGYGKSLRDKVFQNFQIELLVDLGSGVFESATVDTNIIIIKNMPYINKTKAVTLDHSNSKFNMSNFINQNSIEIKFQINDPWAILSPIEQSIKNKIEKYGTPLGKWPGIKINRGILTGLNEAFIINDKKRIEILNSCKTLIEKEETDKLIRPILRGRDIKNNSCNWNGLFIICTHNGYFTSGGLYIDRIDVSQLPSIKNHLDNFYESLKKREDQGDTPYNLRSCAYMDDLNKQKILYSEIVKSPQFFLDKKGEFLPEASSFYLVGDNCELLCDYLNSLFSAYLFKTFYAGGGLGNNGYRYKKSFFVNLPIPKNLLNKNYFESFNLSQKEIDFVKLQISKLFN